MGLLLDILVVEIHLPELYCSFFAPRAFPGHENRVAYPILGNHIL